MRRRVRAGTALIGAGLALLPVTRAAATPAQVLVDDPGRSRQWALDRIGAARAWAVATGEGTTIAIVDSGITVDHPDLAARIDATTDCVRNDDAPGGCRDGAGLDDAGHGTHVAGIAAATADNGIGVAGVAPRARLLGVRVLSAECPGGGGDCGAQGTESDVAEGIRWAADHGADVVNLSLGGVDPAIVGPGRAFAEALQYAWSRGAIPVLVAGNDLLPDGGLVDVPAVIVSATDRDDGPATYSTGVGDARWGLAAPGGEADDQTSCGSARPHGILSTFSRPGQAMAAEGSYACVAGTSMAAPHVAGALAVLRSAGFSPQDAVDRLLATATDLGSPGRDRTFGAGRVDLARALEGVAPTGQPVGSPRDQSPPDTDVTTPSTTPPETIGGGSPATASTAGQGTTTSAGRGPTGPALPSTEATARAGGAGETAGGVSHGGGSAGTPAGPLTAATAAAAAVLAGHAWRYGSARSARRPGAG